MTGRDLSWFLTTWFYEPWPLDQAIAWVHTGGDSDAITVEDRGLAPMPVRLAVTRADGSATRLELPVDMWLGGARHTRCGWRAGRGDAGRDRSRGGFPDIDRSNQSWPAGR